MFILFVLTILFASPSTGWLLEELLLAGWNFLFQMTGIGSVRQVDYGLSFADLQVAGSPC
jgi:hypothetical protein